ncbi:DUF4124 domain-containing protein [Gilvimarinus xylanilyticus]|uniref:DUF4124 domain-containing protein n=1 Tax=Gilvimarinus xylanilyticus TaxID=2944139 RepID=A0A9X2HZR2_9GAMM|nr:DUF4124 domain-containing protein [Gilvimarinus xylanilyticus]MCP8900754.1 DUF4124 domain-containing protein [Gilvimarinus xylanilyticus]
MAFKFGQVWLVFICCVLSAQAQVYTWKDENGKLHFSDQRRVETARAQVIDIGAMPPPPMLDTATPSRYSEPRHALVLEQFYYADDVSDDNKRLIGLYVGGDCVSPTFANFNQLRVHFPEVLKTEKMLQTLIFRSLNQLQYDNVYRAGHYALDSINKAALKHLSASITDLKINACWSQHSHFNGNDILKVAKAENFDLLNVWVEVSWTLRASAEGGQDKEFVTQGVAATRLDRDLTLNSTLQKAFVQAASQLQARSDWREAVALPEGVSGLNAPSNQPALYVARQHLSQVLVALAPWRVRVAEYYQFHGTLPKTFDALGGEIESYSGRAFDDLYLSEPGVLHAELSTVFGDAGHYVALTPVIKPGFTQIQWQCDSSLPQQWVVGLCEGEN